MIESWLNLGFIREVEQLPALAEAAEELGFDGVAVPDRFIMPTKIETKYPYTPDGKMFWPKDIPFPDPWVAISAMAARTSRIRLVSNIYLMGLRDPFSAARAVATASLLSSGRVICGVSAGWLEEEFAIAGIDFKSRGRRLDEMIDVVRKLWTGEPVAYEGTYFRFPEVILSPAPQHDVPVWCGGASKAAMRRTAEHGSGWLGLWYTRKQAIAAVTQLLELRQASPRASEPLEALIGLMGAPTPETLAELRGAGVTGIVATPWQMENPDMAPFEKKREALERYASKWLANR